MASSSRSRLRWLAVLAALLLVGPLSLQRASADDVTLTLVAYSTPQEAYEELIPAFQKTPQGAGVKFETSYGASGDQSRAVAAGLPADVVALSLEPDVTKLVKADLVPETWNQDDFHGFVTDSVVVFAVRPGNPKNIHTWDDLIRSDVEVITPNPLTSGGARWNIMAAFGAQIKQGKSEDQAVEYLRQLFDHVSVQDKSAREALQTFVGGKGDVLLSYENEAITASQKEQKIEYVVPDQTILIENPIAVTSTTKHADQANAFVAYLRTPEAQRIYAQKGYRPVVPAVFDEFKQTFPVPTALFKIDEFGGWDEVTTKFFDPDNGIVAKVQE
jgi:sulfate/thiosulfate transport system substrate-binding protein